MTTLTSEGREGVIAGFDPMLPEPWRIVRRRQDTEDTFTLQVTPLEPAARRTPIPGQFNMIYLFGIGEVPISICSEPGRPMLHTTRDVGGVTHAMAQLTPGEVIGLRGPFGTGWPLEKAQGRDILFVAGGIGLAPLRGALLEVLRMRDEVGRITLLYGARYPSELLYLRELQRLTRLGLRLSITVDHSAEGWEGPVGFVTKLIPSATFDPERVLVMMCGPEIMMRNAVYELWRCGVPNKSLYLSLERNMKCAVGYCGHCQFGSKFICRDGPVYHYDQVEHWLDIPEV